MKRRVHSLAFRQEAVRLALNGEKSKTQTARDLGICQGLLYDWIAKYGPQANSQATGPAEDPQAEVVRLRKALTRAELERDILKKALSICATGELP